MRQKIVIIGGVAGGASCAARLRRLDEECEIVLVERGKHVSYANCGLPYFLGSVIKAGGSLLLLTPEMMAERYRIDVRIEQEAVSIDRAENKVRIKKCRTDEVYDEHYDKLVLATGSSPVFPNLAGIETEGIFKLWTIEDELAIRKRMKSTECKKAVVVGGGFIGLEVAENLTEAGFAVSLVEMQSQVFTPFDPEIAEVLQNGLKENGIELFLSEAVERFSSSDGVIEVSLKSGRTLQCGLVIMSAGTAANSVLAKTAGLSLNERQGILVNEYLQTSDPDIYAVGDVIANDFSAERPLIPLAGPANKQGRCVADLIAGGRNPYTPSACPSVVKLFANTAAVVGKNEKQLHAQGLTKGNDYQTVILTQNDHAAYYPNARPMFIKLIFSMDGKTIYGAQIYGTEGVDKRIDDFSCAIAIGAGIRQLQEMSYAYAPPFSSAKDPVNMAGFAAQNVLDGLVDFAQWDEPDKNPKAVLLDIREKPEIRLAPLEGAVQIPLGRLRAHLHELEKDKPYIVFCTLGVRGYTAARILQQNGFSHVKVYPGGTLFLHAVSGK